MIAGGARAARVELRAELSKRLGLAVEGPAWDPGRRWRVEAPCSLSDVVLSLLGHDEDVILEPLRIRVVERDEAAWHWRKVLTEGPLRPR